LSDLISQISLVSSSDEESDETSFVVDFATFFTDFEWGFVISSGIFSAEAYFFQSKSNNKFHFDFKKYLY
jgi:hypothetical protein